MRAVCGKSCVMLFVLMAVSTSVWADSIPDEDRGLAIALEADRRDTGWRDATVEFIMKLRNRHGQESTRELEARSLEMEEDGDKSLIIFKSPRDVEGTALLTFSHVNDNDDQWLYLPALKRVKRISSGNQSGPFMGSEFAYEDFSSQEVEKYTYQFLREETMDGVDCFVIERKPKHKKSGYTRQIVWYDTEHYRIQKIEYYDRKDALLKTLTTGDYRPYLDKYWRAHDMFMENHQTGKTTRLEWGEFQFQNGLSERDFDKNSLKRIR